MEGDDDGHHIVAANSAAAAAAAAAAAVITIDSSSSSSDDIQKTVSRLYKIWDRTDAMLNQQTFDVAVDEACVRYTCGEVVHLLDLSDDDYYVPSSCLVVTAFLARFEKLQWCLDMVAKVRNTIASQ